MLLPLWCRGLPKPQITPTPPEWTRFSWSDMASKWSDYREGDFKFFRSSHYGSTINSLNQSFFAETDVCPLGCSYQNVEGYWEHLLLLLCLLLFSFVTGFDYCVNPAHGSPPPLLIG